MSDKPEALRLAGQLESGEPVTGSAAAELRRLHEVNQELLEALKAMLEVHGVTQEYADKHIEITQSWVVVSDFARTATAKATGEAT